MRKLVESVLENQSSSDFFLFRVTCGRCGSEYGNKPMRFSKAGVLPTTHTSRLFLGALYEQEAKTAQQAAVCNAAEHMNYCPICKKLVCNQCFLICDELDMCRSCASELGQKGIPVQSDIIEAVV